MIRDVRVSARADADANAIFDWLEVRSPDGAVRWYQAFLAALERLRESADAYSAAPEAHRLGVDLRQVLFKTRKGHSYRALFVIDSEAVHIVSVRGAGQDLASADDIELPD